MAMTPEERKAKRIAAYKREFRRQWANYCAYCGVKLCHKCRRNSGLNAEGVRCGDMATWDHVVVHQRGRGVIGRDKIVACHDCNFDRGDKSIKGWRSSIQQRLEHGTMRPEFEEKARRVIDYDVP